MAKQVAPTPPHGYRFQEGGRCLICGEPATLRREPYNYPVCEDHLYLADITVWRIWKALDPAPGDVFFHHTLFTTNKLIRGMESSLAYHAFTKSPKGVVTLCGSFTKPESATELKSMLEKRHPDHKVICKKIDGYNAARDWATQQTSAQ